MSASMEPISPGPVSPPLAPTSPPSAPTTPQQPDKRKLITNEIVSTEASYLRALEALVQVWVEPLNYSLKNDPTPILNAQEIQTLFCNVQVFAEFHKRFVSDMKICNNDIVENGFGSISGIMKAKDRRVSFARGQIQPDCWGSLFLTFSPFLKMYTMYLNNHANAVNFINEQLKTHKNKKFIQFFEKASVDPRCFGNSLQSLLIQPVQRVPRYKLLLAELLKNTPKNHIDYDDLVKSHDDIGIVASGINQGMKDQEHQNEILSLQSQFTHPISLVAPGRTLIHSGRAIKRGERMVDNDYFFILFNDLFIYCSGSANKYKCHREIPITPQFSATVNSQPPSNKKAQEYSIMIYNESKSFQLILPTKLEMEQWMEKFNHALKGNEDRLKSRKSYITDKTLIKSFLPIFDLRYTRRHARKAIPIGLLYASMPSNIISLIIITLLYSFTAWTIAGGHL